jgi:thymidylate synthase
MTNFDHIYKNLVELILNEGVEELNVRTGQKVKIITGVHFDLNVEDFPALTLRKIPLKLFIAEQIWYLQGDNKLDFFQKFSKIWDDFKEDDNTVESGYGYRWRNYFQRDQLLGLIQLLKKDPSSRQGVVITWDPNTDGLVSRPKKNVPCVPMWEANIVGGKLNMHIIFRSNDVMLGLPHDVAGFALLQHIIAQELGVGLGQLHYTISHAHIYENHYPNAHKLLEREEHEHDEIKLTLPHKSYKRAVAEDEELVEEILADMSAQYHPQPGLGKMQIAL